MFDLEGIPHPLDELEKIYLWASPSSARTPDASAPPSPASAREATTTAGSRAGQCEPIFEEHGDIPFVHWAAYERSRSTCT